MTPSTTTNGTDGVALGFGTWRSPAANRPVMVEVQVTLDPSGTTNAVVEIDVDESGGKTPDYTLEVVSAAGLGAAPPSYRAFWIPAGGSYQIRNVSDPDAGNSIDVLREALR